MTLRVARLSSCRHPRQRRCERWLPRRLRMQRCCGACCSSEHQVVGVLALAPTDDARGVPGGLFAQSRTTPTLIPGFDFGVADNSNSAADHQALSAALLRRLVGLGSAAAEHADHDHDHARSTSARRTLASHLRHARARQCWSTCARQLARTSTRNGERAQLFPACHDPPPTAHRELVVAARAPRFTRRALQRRGLSEHDLAQQSTSSYGSCALPCQRGVPRPTALSTMALAAAPQRCSRWAPLLLH